MAGVIGPRAALRGRCSIRLAIHGQRSREAIFRSLLDEFWRVTETRRYPFTRALSIVAFISFPITTFSGIMFGAVSGLSWLSTVPPTSALVAQMFGTRWFATLYGFAFVSHQVGGFLGVLLGGIVFEKFGSYTPIWWLSVMFGVLSALINLPIVEAPVARPVAQPA